METSTTLPDRARCRADSQNAWRVAAVAFICSRAVLLLVGWLTLAFIATHPQFPHGDKVPVEAIKNLVCRWDCGWYMSIAQHGYSTSSWPPGSSSARADPSAARPPPAQRA